MTNNDAEMNRATFYFPSWEHQSPYTCNGLFCKHYEAFRSLWIHQHRNTLLLLSVGMKHNSNFVKISTLKTANYWYVRKISILSSFFIKKICLLKTSQHEHKSLVFSLSTAVWINWTEAPSLHLPTQYRFFLKMSGRQFNGCVSSVCNTKIHPDVNHMNQKSQEKQKV